MLNSRAEQILARFPGPVTIRPVLTPFLGSFIALSTLIAIGCLWGIWHGTQKVSATWGLAVFAALSAFLAAAAVHALRTDRMTLDRDGFEVVYPFRKKRYRWTDVSAFEWQYWTRGTYVVAFDDLRKGDGILAAVNRATGFRNSGLPEDYGLGEKQLAELLNQWRDRALASGDREPGGLDAQTPHK
jgi:hypothetical protein